MRSAVLLCLLFFVTVLVMPLARADLVVLRNGGKLTGKITRETADEVDLTLADGMRMTIRRARIQTIERDADAEDEPTGNDPLWTPHQPHDQAGDTEPKPEPGAPPRISIPRPAGPFENSPFSAWNGNYARYPVIMAAKNTGFRSYRLVRRSPLAVDPGDPRYSDLLRRHGHGGVLSVWEFAYTGMGELRYGDQVRFIAELTTPSDPENQLIRLKAGPTPTTSRLAVLLVKRQGKIERYATTTVFAPPDFRQDDLKRLPEFQLNVRTYQDDYLPVASTWLEQSRSGFIEEIDSTLGDSIRTRILACRFRLEWLETPPEDRPGLDPDLINRDNLRPLALPGRPVASDELVRRAWGTPRGIVIEHNQLVETLRTSLSKLGIKPDRDYLVEYERVGVLGAKGVSLETRRHSFPKEMLEELLTTR